MMNGIGLMASVFVVVHGVLMLPIRLLQAIIHARKHNEAKITESTVSRTNHKGETIVVKTYKKVYDKEE